MIILGVNAFHGDSSACIVRDGELLAAVDEERFRRIKHWAGFPTESIKYCLEAAQATIGDIDIVAVNKNPWANLGRKLAYFISQRPTFSLIKERITATREINSIPSLLRKNFPNGDFRAKFIPVEHHRAHLASSFLVSPFDQAALLSVDGFGDFLSTMGAVGKGNFINPFMKIYFPHSLGLFYTSITQWLGFKKYGDEYKVMGLAALGKPSYTNLMRKIVLDSQDGFTLNLIYFTHHRENLPYQWVGGEPSFADVYSPALEKLLGPARNYEEPITEYHADIASSLQTRYEEIFFRLLNRLYDKTQLTNLCLAGGCALNSVANGKIFNNTPFKEVYIQPAAHDSGGAIGAAFYAYHAKLGFKRRFIMKSSYWGPEFTLEDLQTALKKLPEQPNGLSLSKFNDQEELIKVTAKKIAEGKIIGWFQGRMEWGPRALGNRSIIVDPRNQNMKNILNSRIKKREPFRPFAPSVLLEATNEYFEQDYPDPFMLKVYEIRPDKQKLIPAVTHVDGTGRLQTVTKEENPLYYGLIKEFEKITNIPMVLNTSFNENEPIVCTPDEAINCFLRTRMDVLVLGPYILERSSDESLN